jgi:hypothetical protein
MRWPGYTAYAFVRNTEAKGHLGDIQLGKGNNNRMDIKATDLATSP